MSMEDTQIEQREEWVIEPVDVELAFETGRPIRITVASSPKELVVEPREADEDAETRPGFNVAPGDIDRAVYQEAEVKITTAESDEMLLVYSREVDNSDFQ